MTPIKTTRLDPQQTQLLQLQLQIQQRYLNFKGFKNALKQIAIKKNISIDYAVMEKAQNVYVLPATFDWNDLGTWGQLHEKLDKDDNDNSVVNATVLLNNSSNNIISTAKDKLVIIDGLEDFIVVDKDNVLLIYPKSKEQEIKGSVSQLKK
jgi:mannose-1-phosphate guanylyltransferase